MAIGRVRAALAALLVGGLAAGVVWVYAGLGGGPGVAGAQSRIVSSEPPSAMPSPRATGPEPRAAAPPSTAPVASASPALTPTPGRLDALRASDAYLEFAEASRARTAPGAGLAYDSFGWHGTDGHEYWFRHRSALWNTVVSPIRDDLLLQGTEFREPLFDVRGKPSHPFVAFYPREPGELQLVAFVCPFIDKGSDVAVRVHAVLLDVVEEGSYRGQASLRARMTPFTVSASDYENWTALATEGIKPELLAWVLQSGQSK